MMMPYTSLHLSLHDIDLLYLDPLSRSLFRRMDKTKPTLLRRKELPEVQEKKNAFNDVSEDLHPRDHVLLSLSVEVKSPST